MTQTNLDYLFQVTAAGIPRLPGASARNGDESLPFGDHFSRSSSAVQDRASSTGGQDTVRHEAPARPSSPVSHDAPQGAAQEPSSGSTDRGFDNNDYAATTTNEANQEDENSGLNPNTDVDSTEQTSGDEEQATDHEDSSELPEGAETAAATAAGTAGVNTLLANAEQSDAANAAKQSAAGDTISTAESTKNEGANESASTRGVHLAADKPGLEQLPEELTSTAQAPATDDANKLAVRPKVGKSTGKKDRASTEENHVDGEQRKGQINPQGAVGGELSPAIEAAVTSDAVDRPNDELAAKSSGDDAKTGADESRRRTTSGANSRTEAASTVQNAVVAAVTDKSASHSGDSSANASAAESTQPTTKTAVAKGDTVVNILGRSHSGVGGANRGPRAAGEEELPRVDPARFVGRVAKAFQTAHDRGGTLQLRLSPPELGALRLELTVKEGVMTAALETETAAARRVLLDHLPALRERLAEQNIRVERFDVDVRRDGGGGQSDDRAAQQQQPDQPPQRRQPSSQPRIGGTTPETQTVSGSTNDTQINFVA